MNRFARAKRYLMVKRILAVLPSLTTLMIYFPAGSFLPSIVLSMIVLVLAWSKITAGVEPWTGSFFAVTMFTFTMIMSLFDSTASSASAATGFSIFAKGGPS